MEMNAAPFCHAYIQTIIYFGKGQEARSCIHCRPMKLLNILI